MKTKCKMTLAALAGVALGAVLMTVNGIATAWAQDAIRIRGSIEGVDGSTYLVKARDGAELKVVLADNPQIASVVKASLSDIKQGTFVGVTAMPKADGSQSALEVHMFPEAMRGTGEGHYPWDLRPQSTMTNANVEQVVTAVDGQTLTLKYKDGEKKIFVPADTPIAGLRARGQERSQAGRESVHRRDQAVGRNAASPHMAGRPGWSHATDVTAARAAYAGLSFICSSTARPKNP